MPFTTGAMYPNTPGSTFDMDYYINKHMPLTAETFGPFGFQGWQVIKPSPGTDGSAPKYHAIALMTFDKAENFGKAVTSPSMAKVGADVPNYTNVQPEGVAGDVVASG